MIRAESSSHSERHKTFVHRARCPSMTYSTERQKALLRLCVLNGRKGIHRRGNLRSALYNVLLKLKLPSEQICRHNSINPSAAGEDEVIL